MIKCIANEDFANKHHTLPGLTSGGSRGVWGGGGEVMVAAAGVPAPQF